MMLRVALLVAFIAATGLCQLQVRQCLCSEVEPCVENIRNASLPCSDSCKSFVNLQGANYTEARDCFLNYTAEVDKTVNCVLANLSDTCAANASTALHLARRNPTTLKLAAYTDINKWLIRQGIAPSVRLVAAQFGQYFLCSKTCVNRKTSKCSERSDCALDLPTDAQLIAIGGDCAKQAGWTSEKLGDLCNCFVESGVSKLKGVCEKL